MVSAYVAFIRPDQLIEMGDLFVHLGLYLFRFSSLAACLYVNIREKSGAILWLERICMGTTLPTGDEGRYPLTPIFSDVSERKFSCVCSQKSIISR